MGKAEGKIGKDEYETYRAAHGAKTAGWPTFERINSGLWSVLILKTLGEARGKVRTAAKGEGVTAWQLLSQWNRDGSRIVLQERLMRLSYPERCVREEDMPCVLDRWTAERDDLEIEGEMEPWHARIAVAKLVSPGTQTLIEAGTINLKLTDRQTFNITAL